MARRTVVRNVTRRTAARRARKHTEAEVARAAARNQPAEPETIGQGRTWDRKKRRYILAGLCDPCAAQAAWGHAIGFTKINDPCSECQALVSVLPDAGPEGSKWRKCLTKLEYLSDEEVKEVLASA